MPMNKESLIFCLTRKNKKYKKKEVLEELPRFEGIETNKKFFHNQPPFVAPVGGIAPLRGD